MSHIFIFMPALIVYAFFAHKIFSEGFYFEYWMLLLIPFFFILNFFLIMIFLRMILIARIVYREAISRRYFSLFCYLIFIFGPMFYFFYYR